MLPLQQRGLLCLVDTGGEVPAGRRHSCWSPRVNPGEGVRVNDLVVRVSFCEVLIRSYLYIPVGIRFEIHIMLKEARVEPWVGRQVLRAGVKRT